MARLREGRANTARGAGHFLTETIGRVRACRRHGASSRCAPTRASTPMPWWRPAGRRTSASASPCASTRACAGSSRPSPRRPGRPSPTGSSGGADVAETDYTPFADRAGRACRCGSSCAGCKPTPGSQLALLHALRLPRLHHRPRRRHRSSSRPTIAVTPRSRTPSATSSTAWPSNHLPSGRFAANGAWLAVQVMAHDLARWTARIGLGEGIVTTKTLRRRLFGLARTAHPLGPSAHAAPAGALALGGGLPARARADPDHPHRGLTATSAAPDPAPRHARHRAHLPSGAPSRSCRWHHRDPTTYLEPLLDPSAASPITAQGSSDLTEANRWIGG